MVLGLAAILRPGAGFASQDLPALCEGAAVEASRRSGVPVSVLKAISLTETGRKSGGSFRPWPWTVNMEGTGHWFETLDEARAYVFKEFKRGARSFDVGCFQINYKWHNQAFSSIDQMFDPLSNAMYAAKFLGELYAETGDWTAAAGAYHSRTKEYADRYSARFADLRQRFAAEDGQPLPPPLQTGSGDIPEIPDIVAMLNPAEVEVKPPRENNYPLLKRDGTPKGSLGGAAGASLFAAALNRVEDTSATDPQTAAQTEVE
ncbi:MAG: transglycosylase SLT domain-containing protein [Sphingomonadales bacterium]|nr:transglycosylase SLT domain-containing protein [Sphingomonadales bacterium]